MSRSRMEERPITPSPETEALAELNPDQVAALRRAFVDNEDDYILVDGWTNQWLRECVDRAMSAGILRQTAYVEGEQYSAFKFELTDAGRRGFEIRRKGCATF